MELGTLVFTYRFSNPNLLLIAAAVVPALVLLTYIYRKDHIEKEPNSLLVRLLLWGIVSTFLAVVTESLSCSAGAPGIRRISTAALTAWCTRCSSRSASRCGRTSGM